MARRLNLHGAFSCANPIQYPAESLFFFNDPAPPKIYTFPYTTLFRSEARRHARRLRPDAGRRRAHAVHEQGDRKSTRLNSSHVEISYAVFCLKKKRDVPLGSVQSFIV